MRGLPRPALDNHAPEEKCRMLLWFDWRAIKRQEKSSNQWRMRTWRFLKSLRVRVPSEKFCVFILLSQKAASSSGQFKTTCSFIFWLWATCNIALLLLGLVFVLSVGCLARRLRFRLPMRWEAHNLESDVTRDKTSEMCANLAKFQLSPVDAPSTRPSTTIGYDLSVEMGKPVISRE